MSARGGVSLTGWVMPRGVCISLCALTAVGFAMRVANIGDYGFSLDEASLVWASAGETLSDIWRIVVTRSPHPPGIFLFLHGILKLTWSPWWLRLPFVLCGTLLIWLSYLLIRELMGRPAGLMVAGLVTFSPALVELSRACRNYTPGFLLFVISLLFLVRYCRSSGWMSLVGFALTAPLALFWHYTFAVGFLSIGLVTMGALLLQRSPPRRWLALGVSALPLAGTAAFLYLAHISQLPPIVMAIHQRWHRTKLAWSLDEVSEPMLSLWAYLAPAWMAPLLVFLSLLGAFVLLVTRRWLALSFYATPLLVAHVFAWSGRFPLGGSRHSAYLFPFLFGLVAANLPALLAGYLWLTEAVARRRPRWSQFWPPSGVIGALAATLLVGTFAVSSFSQYMGHGEYKFRSRSAYGTELLTYYTRDQIEKAFAIVEEQAGPDDIVVMGVQGLFALRVRLKLTPLVRPTPKEQQRRDIRLTLPSKLGGRVPMHRTHNGVNYYFTQKAGFLWSPKRLLAGLDDVIEKFGLEEPSRVWAIRGGWDSRIAPTFENRYPDVEFDSDVDRDSGGWVFAISTEQLRRVGVTGPTDPRAPRRQETGAGRG